VNLLDPGFKHLATVVQRSNVVVRSLSSGREAGRFATAAPVSRLEEFSPDGRFLVLRHAASLSIWDVETGERVFTSDADNPVGDSGGTTERTGLSGPSQGGEIPAFCFAPNQPILLVQQAPRELVFFELPEFREVRRMRAEPDAQGRRLEWHILALSPDGQTLAAGRTTSRLIELVDVESGAVRRRLSNTGRLIAMAWNPKGDLLAAATTDKRVPVWRPATGILNVFLPPMPAMAHSIAFNPEGTLVAAACEDRFVRLVDVMALRYAVESPCTSHRIGFNSEGTRLGPVYRGGEPGWLELTRPSEFYEFSVGDTSMDLIGCQFTHDSRIIAIGNKTNVVLSRIAGARTLQNLSGWRISAFCFDPRGEMVLGAGTPGLFRWPAEWPRLSSLAPGDSENLLPGRGWRAFGFSPDGERFVAANVNSNAALVFDRTLTNLVAELGPHAGTDAVALSPGARWAATGSTTGRDVKLWEVGTGRELLSVAAGAEPQAAFSADGQWLVTFGDTFTLRETGSWAERSLAFPQGRPVVGAAAFSPDGRMLAVVADLFDIQLFDLATLEPMGLLQPPSPVQIHAIAFSPDRTRLAAVGAVARVRVWDLRRIRKELAGFGLDWDLPSVPAE
jgi:WD40 repeat protein